MTEDFTVVIKIVDLKIGRLSQIIQSEIDWVQSNHTLPKDREISKVKLER